LVTEKKQETLVYSATEASDIPQQQLQLWNDLAAQIAIDAIRSTTAAGSGHPTTAMSAAHLLAVLFASHFRFDANDPKSLSNDRFVLSKGHGAPGLYAVMKAAGWISDDDLMSLRKLDSPLEGHPVPLLPGIDVATGSLGQGLAVGVGMALLARREGHPYHVWVLCGDSEMSEGSVWEAVQIASYYSLANLTAIIDVNRLGQRGQTQLGWDLGAYARRLQAFGWHVEVVEDGHDPAAIDAAYTRARSSNDGPTAVVAKTIKGYGFSELADKDGWHGKPLPADMAERAIAELGGPRQIRISVQKPPSPLSGSRRAGAGDSSRIHSSESKGHSSKTTEGWLESPDYQRPVYKDPTATRKAYGDTIAAIARVRPDVWAMDAEVSNSTYAEVFAAAHPDRFVEMFIEEQCMLGAATGMAALGKTVYCSSFAAFLTRAHDFIRMASIGRANLRLCGSHAGVSIGEDGPSQMGLEDLAMMACTHSSTVFSPADANSTVRIVEIMADLDGISYVRTQRNPTPLIYGPGEEFEVGGAKVLRYSDRARAAIVGTGIAVHEALQAAETLSERGIEVAVVDAYCIKPIAAELLREIARSVGLIVTVEDHRPEGGLGDAVASAILERPESSQPVPKLRKLAVYGLPGSGKPDQLRARAGISAEAIASAVLEELNV
jgi:transketolase